MRTHDLLMIARRRLTVAGAEEASLEAAMLLHGVTGEDRARQLAHPETKWMPHVVERFMSMVERRCAGEPVQYILGRAPFMGLMFAVDPAVLVPRADTEILAECALAFIKEDSSVQLESLLHSEHAVHAEHSAHARHAAPLRILDIGTGSGCLPVSVAFHAETHRELRIDALDLSGAALQIAQQNAETHGVDDQIRFLQCDVLRDFHPHESYALILSNPPYIPTDDISGLMREVRDHEPFTALDGGSDGLTFYRFFAAHVHQWLIPGGVFLMEVGIHQAEDVSALFLEAGCETDVVQDLAGIDRVVRAKRRIV